MHYMRARQTPSHAVNQSVRKTDSQSVRRTERETERQTVAELSEMFDMLPGKVKAKGCQCSFDWGCERVERGEWRLEKRVSGWQHFIKCIKQ